MLLNNNNLKIQSSTVAIDVQTSLQNELTEEVFLFINNYRLNNMNSYREIKYGNYLSKI